MRRLAPLALAFALSVTTGAAGFLEAAPCGESCPDDGDADGCPPNCVDCGCCPHLRSAITVTTSSLVLPVEAVRACTFEATSPEAPAPDAIEHVPKTLLA